MAQVAEAKAQLLQWEARTEQVRRKLQADVVAPAQARKSKAEADAKAATASITRRSRSRVGADQPGAGLYGGGSQRARESLLLQKLLPVFEQLTGTMKAIKVDRLTRAADGRRGAAGASGLGPQVVVANEQVRAATGVDLLLAWAVATAVPPSGSGARRSAPAASRPRRPRQERITPLSPSVWRTRMSHSRTLVRGPAALALKAYCDGWLAVGAGLLWLLCLGR